MCAHFSSRKHDSELVTGQLHGQPKVRNFQDRTSITGFANKYVVWFQVEVQDAVGMDVAETL